MPIEYGTNFFYALFRWKGSVWKSVWKELSLWLLFYYALRLVLRYAIPVHYNDTVKLVVELFDSYTKRIPMEFVLGFFVSQVVSRWWSQNVALCNPGDLMSMISAYVHGTDEESRALRHECARHIILTFILAYKRVSSRLQTMFPNNDKFLDVGLITTAEQKVLMHAYPDTQYEIPFQWIQENIRAKVDNHYAILSCMNSHRSQFAALAKYNTFGVPLVYAQTVTIAVYGYFVFCLIGHQLYYSEADTLIPFLTILRFIFSIGWLKVAEDLAKPFGDDDDDTNLCVILQNYIKLIFTIADYVPSTRPGPVMETCGNEVAVECYIEDQKLKLQFDRFLNLCDPETPVKVKHSNATVKDIHELFVRKT